MASDEKQWFDEVLERYYTPRDIEELIWAIDHPKQDAFESTIARIESTPSSGEGFLARFRHVNAIAKEVGAAFAAKRAYIIRTWPEEMPGHDMLWIEHSADEASESYHRAALSAYAGLKCLVRDRRAASDIEALMVLYFSEEAFSEHRDLLEFLLGIPSEAWEPSFLAAADTATFRPDWVRPIVMSAGRFTDRSRLRRILGKWAEMLQGTLPRQDLRTPEERLLAVIFGTDLYCFPETIAGAIRAIDHPEGPPQAASTSEGEPTAWWRAVHSGDLAAVKSLLADPAVLNARDGNGATALHYACKTGNVRLFNILRRHKADVCARDAAGRTPLHQAAGHSSACLMVALLEARADPNAADNAEVAPLLLAAREGSAKGCLRLLSAGAAVNARCREQTPLHAAAERRSKDTVSVLLRAGASVDSLDRNGMTPLHVIADSGNIRDTGCNAAIAQMLLKAGADVDARTPNGRTPLHLAASHNNWETAEQLIAAGATLNAICAQGLTPLHVITAKANAEIVRDFVKELLDRGADLSLRDQRGRTALDLATELGHRPLMALLAGVD